MNQVRIIMWERIRIRCEDALVMVSGEAAEGSMQKSHFSSVQPRRAPAPAARTLMSKIQYGSKKIARGRRSGLGR